MNELFWSIRSAGQQREQEPPCSLPIRAELLFLEINFLITGAKLNCNTRGKYHSVPGKARDCHKGKDVALA